jgi:EpsI family protein
VLSKNAEGVALVVILLLAGLASWWLMLRPITEYDATRFDRLPSALRGWHAVDVEMDESVSEMLAADHNVQRAYHHDQGYVVYVYVGYYGTARGGTPEHTPDVCYPAQGWEIIEAMERRIGGADGFTVQEFVVQKANAQRLVHFWYRTSHTTGITSVPGLRLEHFWGS